jgi:hypothetical protein
LPSTTNISLPPTTKPPPELFLRLQHSRGPRKSCGGVAHTSRRTLSMRPTDLDSGTDLSPGRSSGS